MSGRLAHPPGRGGDRLPARAALAGVPGAEAPLPVASSSRWPALFLAWYFLYVLLAAYAPDFMGIRVVAATSPSACCSAWASSSPRSSITMLYARWANTRAGPDAPSAARAHRERPGRGERHAQPSARRATETSATRPSTSRIFAAFVAVTLVIVFRASRNNRTAADYYAGGRSFTGPQNGIAIAGDYLSAASLPRHRRRDRRQRLRRLPVLDRLPRRLARRAAAGRRAAAQHRQVHDGRRPVVPAASSARSGRRRRISTLAVVVLLPARPDGRRRRPGRAAARRHAARRARASSSWSSASLMILYVLVGGMKGTTWVQIIKAVLLIAGAARDDGLGARASSGSTSPTCCGAPSTGLGRPARRSSSPGKQYGASATQQARTSCRWPSRSCSAPPGCRTCSCASTRCRPPRRPAAVVVWAIWLIGVFYLFTLVLGYGAGALVGPEAILAAPGQGELGGTAARLRARRHDPARASSRPSRSRRSSPSSPV